MEKAIAIFLVWFAFTCFLAGFGMVVLKIFVEPPFWGVFVGSGILTGLFLLISILTGDAEITINNIEVCKKTNQNSQ